MGEIGQPRDTVMYDLRQWELMAIIRGYRKREEMALRNLRLLIFWNLHNGINNLEKAGIKSPLDIFKLPHDIPDDGSLPLTREVIAQLENEIREINAHTS